MISPMFFPTLWLLSGYSAELNAEQASSSISQAVHVHNILHHMRWFARVTLSYFDANASSILNGQEERLA